MGKTKTVIIGETPEEKVQEPKKLTEKEIYERSQAKEQKVEKSEDKLQEDQDVKKEKIEPKKKEVNKATGKKRKHLPRSKKYKEIKKLVDSKKVYSLKDGIELVKKISYAKFDATLDLHVQTILRKNQDPVRGLMALPAGSPKRKSVAIADENTLQEIEKGKINFDILLAKPDMMPRLAKVAKILGPKGLMPNPKSGTVTDDPEKTKKELESGKVEYKSDGQGVIHLSLGKVSWEDDKLISNIEAVLKELPQNRIGKVYLAASMSPSVRIK